MRSRRDAHARRWDEVRLKNIWSHEVRVDTTSRGVQRRLRALRAVLTGAACACRVLKLVDIVCVMLVVLIAHVDVVHAVDTVFVAIFCNWRCTIYTHRR